jgi:hypothetical protein
MESGRSRKRLIAEMSEARGGEEIPLNAPAVSHGCNDRLKLARLLFNSAHKVSDRCIVANTRGSILGPLLISKLKQGIIHRGSAVIRFLSRELRSKFLNLLRTRQQVSRGCLFGHPESL